MLHYVLRPYQQAAVEALRRSYATGHRAPLLVLPTGGGKTHIFAAVTAGTRNKGRRVLVLAHRRELIRQASAKLTAAQVSHGIIAPGVPPTDDIVQVGSVQTVVRRLELMPDFDLIVLDEAHHATAGSWERILDTQKQAKVLGVTATPERADGKGLGISAGGPFDDLVVGPTIAELIAGEFLAAPRTFAPVEGPDLSGVRVRGGDYEPGALAEAMGRAAIIGDAAAHYAAHTPSLPAIAFCASVEHAQGVAAAFRAEGWHAVAAHGGMSLDLRDRAIAELSTGAIQILCVCDLVSEGLDVPSVGAVLLLRPTKSLPLYLQQVGRGLRPDVGKRTLVVLDHAGNSLRHGLPDEPRRWSLDGRPERERCLGRVLQSCPRCLLVQSGGRYCVECGFDIPQPPRAPAPKTAPGVLKELRRLAPDMRYCDIVAGTFAADELEPSLEPADTSVLGSAIGFGNNRSAAAGERQTIAVPHKLLTAAP